MAQSNMSGPLNVPGGFLSDAGFTLTGGRKALGVKTETVTITNGAAAGTFTMPTGVKILLAFAETPVAVPGTPTNTNLRLGSAANGAQYVSDVDVKAQGMIALTVLYAGRNPAATVHFTVASSGGTAADQDSTVLIHLVTSG